ncbi:MAG: amidohydrolase family protein, partial [Longimicrobiales bacterium]
MGNPSGWLARLVRIGRAASVLAACAVTACASGERQDDAVGDVLVIRGGWLFDGTGEEAVRNRGIVIHDSVFADVNVDVSETALEGARVIELTDDEFIIPGMFDLHAHYAVDLLGEGRVDEDRVYPALFLGNGVTSTFPAGEVQPERMRDLRLRIERGEQVGPRVFNSGPYFGSAREDWNDATTAEEIAAEVDHWVSQGARGFKAKNIETRHLEPLIESAHRRGLTVTGHLGSGWRGSVNPRDAILMRIDRIEHFAGGDAMTPDRSAYASLVEMTPDMPEFQEIVELFIERGVNFDATLSAYGYYGRRDPEVYTYF